MNNNRLSQVLASVLLLLVGYHAYSSFQWEGAGLQQARKLTDVGSELSVPGGVRGRRLQSRLVTTVLNNLISLATPRISLAIEYVVDEHLATYDFRWVAHPSELGQAAYMTQKTAIRPILLPSICNESLGEVESYVRYEYKILMTDAFGIRSMSLDRVAFVQGSQDIEIVWGGLRNGANWEAQWIIDTSFTNLTIHTTSILTATVQDPTCGARRQAKSVVNGSFVVESTDATTLATVYGKTGRILNFVDTSEISKGTVHTLKVNYEPFNTSNIGTFNASALDDSPASMAIRNLTSLDVIQPWGDKLHSEFKLYGEKVFKYAAQGELDEILPQSFNRDEM